MLLGLVIPETVIISSFTTSSFSGLSRVILNSDGFGRGVGEASIASPFGLRVELIRTTPNAITRPKVTPAIIAQTTSLRIEHEYTVLITSCQFVRVLVMDITYLGHSNFRIKTKIATIITDPYLTKTDGDIITISHDNFDRSALEKVIGFKKVVEDPGEYEISGVSIIGIGFFQNTIYVYEADGLRLAHLGNLTHLLTDEIVDQIGTLDVLMVSAQKEAAQNVEKIDPYFIIPMNYQEQGSLDSFLKEIGAPVENLPKFSLKKEDIMEDQNTKVIVLHDR